MTKRLMGMLMVMALGAAVSAAQEVNSEKRGNAALDFSATSASQVSLLSGDSVARDFSLSNAEAGAEVPAAPAAKAAKPRYIFGDRDDYRWQLGVGVEFFRFRSSIIDASMVGLNTTLTYFTNSWFAVEGNLITGFAPEIYDREHVKLWGGAGGFRIGGRRQKWEPWAHALIGGAHLQPQTAGNSRNALMAQAGLGVDYRIHARLSLRAEGDWVYTNYFNDMQNNFQGVAGVVLHF
jgi:opacity protein-like surface antigen